MRTEGIGVSNSSFFTRGEMELNKPDCYSNIETAIAIVSLQQKQSYDDNRSNPAPAVTYCLVCWSDFGAGNLLLLFSN